MQNNHSDQTSALTQGVSTPIQNTVPPGRILISLRWRDSSLVGLLQSIRPMFSDHMGVIDFQTDNDTAVVLLLERDLLNLKLCYQRLNKLQQSTFKHKIAVVLQSNITQAAWDELQPAVVLSMTISAVPIHRLEELPQLLSQLSGPQLQLPVPAAESQPADEKLLQLLSCVPELGPRRARQLFQHFGGLANISRASRQNLGGVLGDRLAGSVHEFFNGPVRSNR